MPATIKRWLCGLALCLGGSGALAEPRLMLEIQQSPLAGSQFYALASAWSALRVGDTLTLIREPDNRHDAHAIRVECSGQKLGYVPRAQNRVIARAMDAGEPLLAKVVRLREHADPWQRVEFAVYILL